MLLYKQIINKEEKIALIGLGYVGMPIAVAFAAKGIEVIGFDSNKQKLNFTNQVLTQQKRLAMK